MNFNTFLSNFQENSASSLYPLFFNWHPWQFIQLQNNSRGSLFFHSGFQNFQETQGKDEREQQNSLISGEKQHVSEKQQIFQNDQPKKVEKSKIKKIYVTKNNQTNIINQIISFICFPKRSKQTLLKVLKMNEKKVQDFYLFVKQHKKSKSKYMNKESLLTFCLLNKNSIAQTTFNKAIKKRQNLTLAQCQKTMIFLSIYYLRNLCVQTILCSERLSQISVKSHLAKRREILKSLQQKICLEVELQESIEQL